MRDLLHIVAMYLLSKKIATDTDGFDFSLDFALSQDGYAIFDKSDYRIDNTTNVQGILFSEESPVTQDVSFNSKFMSYERRSFEILVSYDKLSKAREIIYNIYDALREKTSIPNTGIYNIQISNPFYMGENNNKTHTYMIDITCNVRKD